MTNKEVYVVRQLQEDKDESALASIFSECFEPVTQRQVRQFMRRAERDSDGWSRSFVAEVNGEIVSNVTVELKKLHFGEGVYLNSGGIAGVCTRSAFRRRGMATKLFQLGTEYVRNSGISNSSLYTGTMLPASQIYKRKGFRDIEKASIFIKFLNFDRFFQTWARNLNRYIKSSRIAQKTLQNWDRSVGLQLENKVHCFRFKQGRLQMLPKRLTLMDIEITTTVETLVQVLWHATEMSEALQTGKIQVKKGTEVDLKKLETILTGIWDERDGF